MKITMIQLLHRGIVGVVVGVVVGVGVLGEVVVDLASQEVGAGVIEDVTEADHVWPSEDDAGDSRPLVTGVVASLEVVIDVAGHVAPALAHRPIPLEGGGHGGGETVHVGLVLLEVDPANVGEIVPANLLPETESI